MNPEHVAEDVLRGIGRRALRMGYTIDGAWAYTARAVGRAIDEGERSAVRDGWAVELHRKESEPALQIKRGMRVAWRPEWRSPGDDKYTFVAISDSYEDDGEFRVSTVENTMFLRPWSSAYAYMVEAAEPLLPVATFTFLGLARQGARVELRRTRGDEVVSAVVETIARRAFRDTFRKGAADCKAGEVLLSAVEFPDDGQKPHPFR